MIILLVGQVFPRPANLKDGRSRRLLPYDYLNIIMSKLLRYYSEGNTYFITAVINNRNNLLVQHYDLFWDSLLKYKKELEFELIAHVIMEDHIHMVIDPMENNLSKIMQKIKLSFSKKIRYISNQSGLIWQKRFWDHVIRDQNDMNRHIDYIHYNPVKHRYVKSPFDWPMSSIHDFYREGYYSADWGRKEILSIQGDYGE